MVIDYRDGIFVYMNKSIGIFDSGIGGLTVARAIRELMPDEPITYFGDTEHLPYGEKSAAAIRSYSKNITEFLLAEGCKIIVIACNTASAHAYKAVSELAEKVPVVNVIDPAVNYVATKYPSGKIGIIGTKGTVKSRAYLSRLRGASANIQAVSKSTPLLVPMIEEGFFDNNISRAVINSYLQHPPFRKLDALILGCTHFPLIKQEVQEYFGKDTEVIDSAHVVAKEVKRKLARKKSGLKSYQGQHDRFFVSDFTGSFEQSSKIFFGERIHLKEINLG